MGVGVGVVGSRAWLCRLLWLNNLPSISQLVSGEVRTQTWVLSNSVSSVHPTKDNTAYFLGFL